MGAVRRCLVIRREEERPGRDPLFRAETDFLALFSLRCFPKFPIRSFPSFPSFHIVWRVPGEASWRDGWARGPCAVYDNAWAQDGRSQRLCRQAGKIVGLLSACKILAVVLSGGVLRWMLIGEAEEDKHERSYVWVVGGG
jgi:hypothetical protein